MDNRMKQELDHWLITNPDEDRKEDEMIEAGTEVRCPNCEERFTVEEEMYNGDVIECDVCGEDLRLEGGVLQLAEEDIYEEDDDSEEDEEEEDEEFEDEDEESGESEEAEDDEQARRRDIKR